MGARIIVQGIKKMAQSLSPMPFLFNQSSLKHF